MVVNDLGSARDGGGSDCSPADAVVHEVRAAGGSAIADHGDVSDLDQAERMVNTAVAEFGRLDAVVNNAGILRDRMLFNMSGEDWDAVMRVHLKGSFALTHHAVRHWRALVKDGQQVDARIVCTSSPSGLYGNVGQANYAAAKAGLVGFTLTLAKEVEKYGIAVNALSPGARTRMTEGLFDMDEGADLWAPENVSPALAWLLSDAARGLTGTVLEVEAGWVGFAAPWTHGPRRRQTDRHWSVDDVDRVMPELWRDYRESVEDRQ